MALVGSSVAERIWNYFKAKGLNDFAIAGLMANMKAESGLLFNNLEDLCERRLKENGKPYYTDETYTAAVDSGKISRAEFLNPLPNKQYGYGVVQWTSPGRKAGLYDLVKQREVSIADEQTQLDYLMQELQTSYQSVYNVLKTATSVRQASDVVLKKFEQPSDVSEKVCAARAKNGQEYYNMFANKSNSSTSGSTGSNTMSEDELRKLVVTTAEKYLGCKESDGSHKKIIDIYNGHKPLARGYKVSYTDAWCATYVSAIAILLGLTSIMPTECGCGDMIELYQKLGRWVENDAYVPKFGDIIMYFWNDSGVGDCTGYPDHVGFVVSVTGQTIKVIEGNKNDSVSYRTININGRYIRGYCVPNYASISIPSTSTPTSPQPSAPTPKPTETVLLNETVKWKGYVTADELNVRSWAGQENSLCSFSPLKENDVVGVCDSVQANDGVIWYFIKYKKKYGFVSSKYIQKKLSNDGGTASSNEGSANTKVDYADSYKKSLAGTYKATTALNLRAGAGTNKSIIDVIPQGGKVNCYGYYTVVNGVKWYLVTYKTYTGFVSSEYLTK